MYTIFHAPLRHTEQLAVEGAEIPEPVQLPPPDERPVWIRYMPLIMVSIIVGMFAIFVITGVRAITSMMYTMPMMLMMLVMHLGMSHGQGGGSHNLSGEIEEYDLLLRESRARIYEHGRGMHNLRTMCFPNPHDLTSLVGTNEMWQADPDPAIGRVVPPDADADPDVKYLTANPYLRARVGIGTAPLYPKLKIADDVVPEMLEPATMVRYRAAMNTLSVVANLPIDVRLHEYPAYAMRGDEEPRLSLVRAMLMSLAFNHSPNLLNIGIVTDDPQQWQWLKWLPHNEDTTRVEPGTGARLLSWRSMDEFAVGHAKVIEQMRSDSTTKPPHLLVVVDTPQQPVSWPQNMIGGVNGITLLVVRFGGDHVTGEKARVLLRGGRVSTLQDFDAAAADYVSMTTAETFARAMHRYRPRNYGSGVAVTDDRDERIPDFFEVLGIADVETHDLVKVWKENAYTDELKVPYGYRRNGDTLTPEITSLDFTEVNRGGDGPHGAVAGQTGWGKSYFLVAVVFSLLAKYGPDKLALILADFKGGSTFLGMKNMPQVVASISNLKSTTELVDRLGEVVEGDLKRRETFITEERHCKDIYEYREEQRKHPNDPDWPPIPDLIVIIDECGQFLKERKDYLSMLIEIGRVGRSLGMHLLICSQFLDKQVIGDLMEHLTFRFCLNVESPQYSVAMIGTDAAANMVAGKLKGKILRRLPRDAQPVEVAAFHHEGEYVRRTAVESAARSRGHTEFVSEPVLLFDLFSDREFTAISDGEEVQVREEKRGEKMGKVLLQKIGRLENMRNPFVANMWQRSLRDPVALPDLNLERQTSGLAIRIGDIDVPREQMRVPWNVDFQGTTAHYLVAGGQKSGRTTLLQQMVVAGCLQHDPSRLMFMLIDNGTGKLGEVRNCPNVGAYARPGDTDTVDRIIGEMTRLVELRTGAMVDREAYSPDAYFESKVRSPIPGDPYGYVIAAVDNIGIFLGTEERRERAELLQPVLTRGAAVGIHLVVTADSGESGQTGNIIHYSMKFPGMIQLPSNDYAGAGVPAMIRMELPQLIPPVGQPGRSVQVFPAEGGTEAYVTLKCRTALPLNRAIEPDRMEFDREVYAVHDYGKEITALCGQLRNTYADQIVPPVQPAAPLIPYEDMWRVFAAMSNPDRNPVHSILPLGSAMGTLALTPIPNYSQNLLVYGEKGCGKTSALRSVMESVMRQFTPESAMVVVIDPLKNMLAERDVLYDRGFMRRAKYTEQADGSKKIVCPPGYVTSADDIKAAVEMLVRLMGSRRPGDDASAAELGERTYFTGPEVYVFVDNFPQMTSGYAARSAFDDVVVGNETVSRLLSTGTDLGVHFIVSSGVMFPDQVGVSPFLLGLRDGMQAPILQLAAPPSTNSPIRQAFHLKPQRWRAGRGRIIVDDQDYTAVQLALIAGPPS
jgi:S-DNA-T family DNA segregation ATPase FtsK/SpoIIIE